MNLLKIFSYFSLLLSKNKLNRFADRQLGKSDCGVSVIKTVMNLAGYNKNRFDIRDNLMLDETGLSFEHLKSYLSESGFACKYKVLDLANTDPEKTKQMMPCVGLVKNKHNNHYIYIHAVNKHFVLIMDPAFGNFDIRPIAYLQNNLIRVQSKPNEEITLSFIESYVNKKLSALKIEPREAQDYKQLITDFNKIRYAEWLSEEMGFSDDDSKAKFINNLLANNDESSIPSKFKTFRVNNEDVMIKAPIVLSVEPVYIKDKNEVKGEQIENSVMKLLHAITKIREIRKSLVIMLIAGFVISLVSYVVIYSNQLLIDEVLPKRDIGTLYVFIGILFFFKGFEVFMNLIKSFTEVLMTQALDKWFYNVFNRAILFSDIETVKSYSRGDLAQRINDLLRMKGIVSNYINHVFFNVIIVAYTLMMSTYISFKVGLIICTVGFIYFVVLKKAAGYIKQLESRQFNEKGGLVNTLIDNVEGHAVIRKNNLEHRFAENQKQGVNVFLSIQRKSLIAKHLLNYFPQLITVIAGLAIIMVSAKDHIVTNQLSLGQIFTLIALGSMGFVAMRTILMTQLNLQEQTVVVDRFFEVANLVEQEQETIDELVKHVYSIEIRDTAYNYSNSNFHLKIDQLNLNTGDRILIEGQNGSGKSTFLNILANNIAKNVEGSIAFYDENKTPIETRAGFKRVLIIRAEDKIFNDTIQFNVLFNKSKRIPDIYRLAEKIGADDFITPKVNPIDSIIYDQGGNLSTGQRRKILILRALLSDADVIIFDEIFRGIDNRSKLKIIDTLNSMNDEKIFLFTTHEPLDDLHINRQIEFVDGKINQETTNKNEGAPEVVRSYP